MNQYPKNGTNIKPDTTKELPFKKASGVESKVLSDANNQKQVEPNPPGMGKKKRKPRMKREKVETNKTVDENSGQLITENTAKAGKSQTNFRKSIVFYNKQGRNLKAATNNVPQSEKLAEGISANINDSNNKTLLGELRKSKPDGGDGPKNTTELAEQGTRVYEKRSGGRRYHYSDKIVAIFKCTKAECLKRWKSRHGWTNGYIQRCRVCHNTGKIIASRKEKIITFDPLSTDEASAIELLTPTEETIVTTANLIINNQPFTQNGGFHNRGLCDMCQKLKRSCLNKKKVEIIESRDANGNILENITWINGTVE